MTVSVILHEGEIKPNCPQCSSLNLTKVFCNDGSKYVCEDCIWESDKLLS